MTKSISKARWPLRVAINAAALSFPLLLSAQTGQSEHGAHHLHQDTKAYIAPVPDSKAAATGSEASPPADWKAGNALDAAAFAKTLHAGEKPTVVYVGFRGLFHAGRIPGATLHGPASQPEGLAELRAWAKAQPRGARIVLYCGCCPMEHCPNVTPAFTALREMGFTNVQVLVLPTNFATDWVERGYPVERN